MCPEAPVYESTGSLYFTRGATQFSNTPKQNQTGNTTLTAQTGNINTTSKPVKKSAKDRSLEKVREIEIMAALKHPNIVQLMGVCVNEDKYEILICMELMDSALDKILAKNRSDPSEFAITASQMLSMMIGIADALHFLHSQKPAIVHRDIKSENVLEKVVPN